MALECISECEIISIPLHQKRRLLSFELGSRAVLPHSVTFMPCLIKMTLNFPQETIRLSCSVQRWVSTALYSLMSCFESAGWLLWVNIRSPGVFLVTVDDRSGTDPNEQWPRNLLWKPGDLCEKTTLGLISWWIRRHVQSSVMGVRAGLASTVVELSPLLSILLSVRGMLCLAAAVLPPTELFAVVVQPTELVGKPRHSFPSVWSAEQSSGRDCFQPLAVL